MSASLKELWLDGRSGTLNALETVKAWAFKQVYTDEGYPEYGMYEKVAEKVVKVGGGCPSRDGVRKAIAKIEEDPAWYPGNGPRYNSRADPACGTMETIPSTIPI